MILYRVKMLNIQLNRMLIHLILQKSLFNDSFFSLLLFFAIFSLSILKLMHEYVSRILYWIRFNMVDFSIRTMAMKF